MERETATHSSILAWEIPGTEEPGGLQSMELKAFGHALATYKQPQCNRTLCSDRHPISTLSGMGTHKCMATD